MLKKVIKKLIKKIQPERIKKGRVIIESDGKYDNGWVFYQYVKKHYKGKYHFIFLAEEEKNNFFFFIANRLRRDKIRFLRKTFDYCFITYCIPIEFNENTKKIYFGHGISMKKVPWLFRAYYEKGYFFITPTQKIVDQYSSLGNKIDNYLFQTPRIDLLQENDHRKKEILFTD